MSILNVESSDLMTLMCTQKDRIHLLLALPSHVPIDDLDEMICELDVAVISKEWEAAMNIQNSYSKVCLCFKIWNS